jgi:signal transduction histidine kinase
LKDNSYTISNISKTNNYFQTIIKIVSTPGNTVWALTSEGIILKTSSPTFPSAATAPPLFLTSLHVNNRELLSSLNQFSYKENNLSFYVATASFTDEKSIRYSYLLEGGGNAVWSEPSNIASFNVVNLAPGKYTLKVKAEFPEGIYPAQTLEYFFTIQSPWWQTLWFRILSIAIFAMLVILIVRFYYRRKLEKKIVLLQKQQAVEKERTRIATDMHDDLGAGLSRIKFLSETIGIKKQQQQPIEEDIGKIREYSHQMIDKMGEIVWALNEKNDSLSDLLSYTRSYCMEYLQQSGINCQVQMPVNYKDDFIRGEFRRNIFLSVKEILHNIVKHAEADHVSIIIDTKKNLVIQIKDDGKGFDPFHVRPFSNGLSNIKKRMQDIGGSSEIKNDSGVLIVLTAPLP